MMPIRQVAITGTEYSRGANGIRAEKPSKMTPKTIVIVLIKRNEIGQLYDCSCEPGVCRIGVFSF